jgi:hypothetical protein
VDYDNDGILDFISGSYDPGDIYLFRGLGKGKYAGVENIYDKSDLPLVHHPEELARFEKLKNNPSADEDASMSAGVASFGSWVAPVDWEADGDLDLLIGSFGGKLFLRINEGTRERPEYGTRSIPVEADGQPLDVTMHCAPVVADWNEDGLWDLVVGSGDGSVGWFPNQGDVTTPSFGPYQQLVSPASDSKFFQQFVGPADEPTHGVRAQICVTDYNLDGRPDLILGDYSDVRRQRQLTAAEQAKFDELIDIHERMMVLANKLREEYYADTEYEQLKKKQETLQAEYEKLDRKLNAYTAGGGSASYIWLFLRKDSETANTGQDGHAARTATSATALARTKPVRIKVSLENRAGDQLLLLVGLVIQPGWHIYGDLPAGSPQRTTRLELELPDGVEAVGEWSRPAGLPSRKNMSEKIYRGRVTFSRMLKVYGRPTDSSIRVKIDYQACTDTFCFPPGVLEQSVTLLP